MPTKSSSSKSKPAVKNEKAAAPKQKITLAQIAFGLFALLMVVTMILSLVAQGS